MTSSPDVRGRIIKVDSDNIKVRKEILGSDKVKMGEKPENITRTLLNPKPAATKPPNSFQDTRTTMFRQDVKFRASEAAQPKLDSIYKDYKIHNRKLVQQKRASPPKMPHVTPRVTHREIGKEMVPRQLQRRGAANMERELIRDHNRQELRRQIPQEGHRKNEPQRKLIRRDFGGRREEYDKRESRKIPVRPMIRDEKRRSLDKAPHPSVPPIRYIDSNAKHLEKRPMRANSRENYPEKARRMSSGSTQGHDRKYVPTRNPPAEEKRPHASIPSTKDGSKEDKTSKSPKQTLERRSLSTSKPKSEKLSKKPSSRESSTHPPQPRKWEKAEPCFGGIRKRLAGNDYYPKKIPTFNSVQKNNLLDFKVFLTTLGFTVFL